MTRDGSSRDSFFGRAGQLAVVSELLAREVNAAIPEVDEGEDTLAFINTDPDVGRIQVKAATATPLKTEGCYSARVSIPLTHLQAEENAPLHYIFPVRFGARWSDFVIILRSELFAQFDDHKIGHLHPKTNALQLVLSFSPKGLVCSERDWSAFHNAWESLPVVQRRQTQKE